MLKPIYKYVPTVREYEEYLLEVEYVKGWNDAMDFMFPKAKKDREKEKIRKQLKQIKEQPNEHTTDD